MDTITLALFGWIPAALLLFVLMPPRRAVIATFLIGWLFLPMAAYQFEGLPNLTKYASVSYAALLGVLLFDAARLSTFRTRLIDTPMLLWCLLPFATSLANGLGAYDGVSSIFDQVMTWGVPYVLGRLYLNNLDDLREMAIAIVIGGLIYVPLCLIEVRISPQLHNLCYGFHQHSFRQQVRYGGYRPMVFMQHGLMVALWMASATLLAFWMWRSRSLNRSQMAAVPLVLPALFAVTVLCKSLNALVLLCFGFLTLWFARTTGSKVVLIGLLLVAPVYVGIRVTGAVQVEPLVEAVAVIDPDRAQSFDQRLQYEVLLMERAKEQPLLGWGGWGRSRVFDDRGKDITVTDGFWIIVFGQNGLIGLFLILTILSLPGLLLVRRCPARLWAHPAVAPAAGLAVVCTLYLVDNLPNAMINPIITLALGGIVGMGFRISASELRAHEHIS